MRMLARFFCIGAAAALLAACSGSQPPIGAPGEMPQTQTSAVAAHAERGGSWMLTEASSEDLLYASRYSAGVAVYSYPSGRKVGELNGMMNLRGLCSDADGNVYVTSESGDVYEFAHGGTSPIKTFAGAGSAYGCAVDSLTGDLAVTNYSSGGRSGYGDVAVFQSGSKTVTTYSLKDIAEFLFCTYDEQGNLYASGISAS